MASMLNRAAFRLARPAVRQTNRRMGTAVESTVPEAALQPKKTYTSGAKTLMDAEHRRGHRERHRRLTCSPALTLTGWVGIAWGMEK